MTQAPRELGEAQERETAELKELAKRAPTDRTIALVGLMGVGKTTLGRRLAHVLHLPFMDADHEIERAAGLSVTEIFARHGEEEFRRGERNVIARLLEGPAHVLATGGGAFMDEQTREKMRARALTVWLRTPIEVLVRRLDRRDTRPLLRQGDPETILRRLAAEREPIYAEADLTVDTPNGSHAASLTALLQALAAYAAKRESR